jgi:hypothetical protein
VTRLLALAGLLFAPAALAQAFDPAEVNAGMLIYKPDIANCEVCHGWQGAGTFLHDDFWTRSVATGPPILHATLDRAGTIELIACGTVTSELKKPHYLPEAWTPRHPCWGKVAADMPPDELPPPAPRPLTQAQIEAVVTYVQAVYQSGGMTLGVCMQYFGEKSKGCDLFR